MSIEVIVSEEDTLSNSPDKEFFSCQTTGFYASMSSRSGYSIGPMHINEEEQQPIQIQVAKESIDFEIERDLTTALPLYSEREKVRQLMANYLPLPYSIAEYGCARKTDIILNKLYEFGVPIYGLKRGMIMELDMSPEAITERDPSKRKDPLLIKNPLHHNADIENPTLQKMLQEKCPGVVIKSNKLIAERFNLHLHEQLQFVEARSHIFPIVIFWDTQKNCPREEVVDLTISPDTLFPVNNMRSNLSSSQSLIFTASMMGRFWLDQKYLTRKQKKVTEEFPEKAFTEMNLHQKMVQKLNQAATGSIGDPKTWSYANNVATEKRKATGKGNGLLSMIKALLYDREHYFESVLEKRSTLERKIEALEIESFLAKDANRAEKELRPLSRVANVIAYHRSLEVLSHQIKKGGTLYKCLDNIEQCEDVFHGIGTKLRYDLEHLASVSSDKKGEINAQALNPYFNEAAIETIHLMNKSGLKVCIDSVGNIHGLLINQETEESIKNGDISLESLTKEALCHCSHIDTVKNAGKYDGRLGVLSGIEVAATLFDLNRHYDIETIYPQVPRPLMVTAFMGEEMTFTGKDISMPGSAAVGEITPVSHIHEMTNEAGEVFGPQLKKMLTRLKKEQKAKNIQLVNQLNSKKLINDCFEPAAFYTPHTYERHIEQGPVLDRAEAPLTLVDTIMGIWQGDFRFKGPKAEIAALEFVGRLRKLALEEAFAGNRVTNGVFEYRSSSRAGASIPYAIRWNIEGELNHAGATLTQDRRDPLVAASRLAEYFQSLVEKYNQETRKSYTAVIGSVSVNPGTNRNVIPKSVGVTLGIQEADLPNDVWLEWVGNLNQYAVKVLAKNVDEGGEGIVTCRTDMIDFITFAEEIRVSLDLRDGDKQKIQQFQNHTYQEAVNVAEKYQIEQDHKEEQSIDPYALSESGQILQIERSYGGSHNPSETMLALDILRGTGLALATSLEFIQQETSPHQNLFAQAHANVPKEWKKRCDLFVSGALHDTCNIAKRKLLEQ